MTTKRLPRPAPSLRATTRPEFPPSPVVPPPSSEISAAAAEEIRAGRSIADAFEKMTVNETTPLARPRDAPAADGGADVERAGMPFEKLWEGLILHAQDPQNGDFPLGKLG